MVTMKLMGILNVTPDSFSDGGEHFTLQSALKQADRMVKEGAHIIDVGGESTRPFAAPVSTEEELARVIPAIKGIRKKHNISISIDTTKADVAHKALAAGADIINDVSALHQDPAMLELVQSTAVPVIIMHMKGSPDTMQVNPDYDNVVNEVLDFFRERLQHLKDNNVNLNRITIDPGIGFGKTLDHNLSLLNNLNRLSTLGQPVLLGHSRKRFIGDVTGREMDERDLPTAVISALASSQKIDMIRVHNVAASRDAIKITQAILSAQ
jgi:dihydropteroate synthase